MIVIYTSPGWEFNIDIDWISTESYCDYIIVLQIFYANDWFQLIFNEKTRKKMLCKFLYYTYEEFGLFIYLWYFTYCDMHG